MKLVLLITFIMLMTGCATPSEKFNQQALDMGFDVEQSASSLFQHKIYVANRFKSDVLHVYLDGDGTPWERNRWIAEDPTARNPLILALMQQDKAPAILLGRPCYYGLNHLQTCDNKYWTSHRYAREVVDSMVQVLNGWLLKHPYNEVVLIGYSGGGALAILMADKIKAVSTVVTVAANLDVTKWSEFHGYSALVQSMNPADEKMLNTAIKQIHFAGKDDEIVPSFIIKEYAEQQQNAQYYEFPEKDHACCWDDNWSKLLGLIQ